MLLFLGFMNIFSRVESLCCTQHLEKNNLEKLKCHCSSASDQQRITADIYGSQNKVLLQDELADAIDSVDFQAKLSRLEPVWNGIAQGFHRWFEKNCAVIFMECLTLEAREKHGISTRFITNLLESMHRLQKNTLKEDDAPKEIVSVSEFLRRWVMTFFSEAIRAIRGLGKYRLSKAFEDFFVEPTKRVQWLDERRNQHFECRTKSICL